MLIAAWEVHLVSFVPKGTALLVEYEIDCAVMPNVEIWPLSLLDFSALSRHIFYRFFSTGVIILHWHDSVSQRSFYLYVCFVPEEIFSSIIVQFAEPVFCCHLPSIGYWRIRFWEVVPKKSVQIVVSL